ncbi:putative polyol transporter 6-like protein, partial [Trifolium pratense]
MAGALLFIKEELMISDMQVQLLAGILNVCALPACMIAGRLSDYIGRRYTIMLSSIFFFLGSTLMGYGSSFPILITGRSIAGFGVGFALIIAPVYSAEISSPSYRGFLTSLPDLSINIVTWVYSSEIFPLRLRAQGLGVCVVVNRITNVAVVTSFISIFKTITLGGTFFMLVGINALGWWFYYSFLPETKGRSLEDMETIFGKDSKVE